MKPMQKKLKGALLIFALFLLTPKPSEAYITIEPFFKDCNFGIGMGARYIDFDLKFNGLKQHYSPGNGGGMNVYFQKNLNPHIGLDVSIYQEWNGPKKLQGINDSGKMETIEYFSEGNSAILKIGLYRQALDQVQIGLDAAYLPLGLRATDVIANKFNGYSYGVLPFLKVSLPKTSKHAGSLTVYAGKAIGGNFTGGMVGGSLNYEFRTERSSR